MKRAPTFCAGQLGGADPLVPFREVEVRVDFERAVPFLETLMQEFKIPGNVQKVDTAVK